MKKAFSFLLVVMSFLLTTSAFAADAHTSGLYTYELKGNGTATITEFNWKENGNIDVFIPSMIDGYTVTSIGNEAFRYHGTNLSTSAVRMWKSNKNMPTITIPDTIKTIGEKAFWGTNLAAINIPNSVEVIGAGAFFDCISCQFKISPNHPYFAVIGNGLYNKAKKELISYSTNLESEKAFIQIPNGIKSIGDYALVFFNKVNVEKRYVPYQTISFPDTVTKVGKYAFAGARFASSVYSPVEIFSFPFTEIGEGAFMSASFDSSASFQSLEVMGEKSFAGAYFDNNKAEYKLLYLGDKLTEIPDGVFTEMNTNKCFSSNGRKTINTSNLNKIGRNNSILGKAFTSAMDFSPLLTTIPTKLYPAVSSLPITITTIETDAFEKVTNFKLPASLENIASDAFAVGSTFIVEAGTYAELWCSENGFGYTIEGQNNLDWLNN